MNHRVSQAFVLLGVFWLQRNQLVFDNRFFKMIQEPDFAVIRDYEPLTD